jgi:hypothetical protein
MATLMTRDVKREEWAEPRALPFDDPPTTRVEWLWTLIALALLVTLLALVIDDQAFRRLFAAH